MYYTQNHRSVSKYILIIGIVILYLLVKADYNLCDYAFKNVTSISSASNSASGATNGNLFSGANNYTFSKNGSFLLIDASRKWPPNSKREISFRFKTKSPHGLLLYQTIDNYNSNNKQTRDQDDQDQTDYVRQPIKSIGIISNKNPRSESIISATKHVQLKLLDRRRKWTNDLSLATSIKHEYDNNMQEKEDDEDEQGNVKSDIDIFIPNEESKASEKLINSMFSLSLAAPINGNKVLSPNHLATLAAVGGPNMIPVAGGQSSPLMSTIDSATATSSSRYNPFLINEKIAIQSINSHKHHHHQQQQQLQRHQHQVANNNGYMGRVGGKGHVIGSLLQQNNRIMNTNNLINNINIINSQLASGQSNSNSAINELYLKLENGRLKITYEYENKLNQSLCGRGLNDDRWHRVDLRVDPDSNQMLLVLDQFITVEIMLSPAQPTNSNDMDEPIQMQSNNVIINNMIGLSGSPTTTIRGSTLGLSNNGASVAEMDGKKLDVAADSLASSANPYGGESVLYLGGLDSRKAILRGVRKRLYTAQFIGCIGQIVVKSDLTSDHIFTPARIDRMNNVQRGCINKCDLENYCLHNSNCVNYYTHAECDCFGTRYQDRYCWNDQRTTLTMSGHSLLAYRIYDWRDRFHSSQNRLSIQFKTFANDAILFFAYGDLNSQQNYIKSTTTSSSTTSTPITSTTSGLNTTQTINPGGVVNPLVLVAANQLAATRPVILATPIMTTTTTMTTNVFSNYLAISLSNGSAIVELNFGDQPLVLSDLLLERVMNNGNHGNKAKKLTSLADGQWHNITFLHSNRQITLIVDEFSVTYSIQAKNNHFYFDPGVYFGGIPNLLYNETRILMKPLNLKHKFVGCLRSVYFNQQDVLLALSRNQTNLVDYRDSTSKIILDSCPSAPLQPSQLALTFKSGRSYLTFQLNKSSQQLAAATASVTSAQSAKSAKLLSPDERNLSSINNSATNIGGINELAESQSHLQSQLPSSSTTFISKKLIIIEFDYKTAQKAHFLAGGHLRDLGYHDLGGFWTLHANHDCKLYFTISLGLISEPEQAIGLEADEGHCDAMAWFHIKISMLSGDKTLNITRSKLADVNIKKPSSDEGIQSAQQQQQQQQQRVWQRSYTLKSSLELLHQVQIGGDLAKFGDTSSIPFTGCIRKISINGRLYDSREFATNYQQSQQQQQSASITVNDNTNIQSIYNRTSSSATTTTSTSTVVALDTITSWQSHGPITLDSCQLVNGCQTQQNPCKNNGTCKLNDVGELECDCSRTGYTGKRCQFSIYKQSCQGLYLSGQRKSAYYLIDLDRNGPLRPIRVRCNMDDGYDAIETVLSHNLPADFFIRSDSSRDLSFNITYLAFQHLINNDGVYQFNSSDRSMQDDQNLMLRTIIDQSIQCKQSIKIECKSSPLYLGQRTWFVAPWPRDHAITSLDGSSMSIISSPSSSPNGRCMCASTEKRCLEPSKVCNCDSNDPIWVDDSHEFIGQSNVGVTRIIQLRNSYKYKEVSVPNLGVNDINESQQHQQQQQQHGQQQQARDSKTTTTMLPASSAVTTFAPSDSSPGATRFTLGDLKCYGLERAINQYEITFKTSDAYIEVPGWRRGDLSFSFRTASSPPAIILYQLATSRNHGYFRLTLISDQRLQFEFIVNRRPRKAQIMSSHKLNNGEWQQVYIEYDSQNLRLTINDESLMIDLDNINAGNAASASNSGLGSGGSGNLGGDYLGTFEGPLFVGGAPARYLVGDLSKRNGFTGCFRALVIGGQSIDLRSYLSPLMPTVTSGCRPSCSKNLCQNGARCIEYWGQYECECSNPFAHSGINCEININTNSITFITAESYYLQTQTNNHIGSSMSMPMSISMTDSSSMLIMLDTASNQQQLISNSAPFLTKNILLNIRTFQESALILYATDQTNFIQLHKKDSYLVLTYNSNTTLVSIQVPIDERQNLTSFVTELPNLSQPLQQQQQQQQSSPTPTTNSANLLSDQSNGNNISSANQQQQQSIPAATNQAIKFGNMSGNGQPIQIKIERHRLRTTLHVNSNFATAEKPIHLIGPQHLPAGQWLNPDLDLVKTKQLTSSLLRSNKLFMNQAKQPTSLSSSSSSNSMIMSSASASASSATSTSSGSVVTSAIVSQTSSLYPTYSQIFLANVDEQYYSTRLPGFTG